MGDGNFVGRVWLNLERGAGQIGWNGGRPGVEVVVEATNAAVGDVHTTRDENDVVGSEGEGGGFAVLTWPPGRYDDDIRVLDAESGEVIAEGSISVNIAE